MYEQFTCIFLQNSIGIFKIIHYFCGFETDQKSISHPLCFLSLRLAPPFPPLLLPLLPELLDCRPWMTPGLELLSCCLVSGLNLIWGRLPPDDLADLVVVVDADDVVEAEWACTDCS